MSGKLSFIQHNVNRQPKAQRAILQQAVESQTDLIFLQEPAFTRNPRNGTWIYY